jgi:hypothetical protein
VADIERISSSEYAIDGNLSRFTGMARDEHIYKAGHLNSVSRYLADPKLTETFSKLVTLSSLPLKGIENNFAVDSSGFSTCRFVK